MTNYSEDIKPSVRNAVREAMEDQKSSNFDGWVIASEEEEKVSKGNAFVSGHRWESLTTDSTVDTMIKNPIGSGKECRLNTFSLSAEGLTRFDTYIDSSVITVGTELNEVNRNIGNTITSDVGVYYDGSYTTGTKVSKSILGGRGVGRRGISASAEAEPFHIKPGHNIHLRISNKSGTSGDISFSVKWYEK